MPIRRHHRWLNPIDWRELSASIRFRRAQESLSANQGTAQRSAAWQAAQLSQAQANIDLRLGAVSTGDAE